MKRSLKIAVCAVMGIGVLYAPILVSFNYSKDHKLTYITIIVPQSVPLCEPSYCPISRARILHVSNNPHHLIILYVGVRCAWETGQCYVANICDRGDYSRYHLGRVSAP